MSRKKLNSTKAAERLGISRKALMRRAKSGAIGCEVHPPITEGGKPLYVFPVADLEAYEAKIRRSGPAPITPPQQRKRGRRVVKAQG